MKVKASLRIEISGGTGSAEHVDLSGTDTDATLTFHKPHHEPVKMMMDVGHVRDLYRTLEAYLQKVGNFNDSVGRA